MLLANQLPDVQFPRRCHLRRASVFKMRVVCPNCDFCGRASYVGDNRFKRVNHVSVAKVPRPCLALEHFPVITLGICHQSRVLFGGKKSLGIQIPVALAEIGSVPLHLH